MNSTHATAKYARYWRTERAIRAAYRLEDIYSDMLDRLPWRADDPWYRDVESELWRVRFALIRHGAVN